MNLMNENYLLMTMTMNENYFLKMIHYLKILKNSWNYYWNWMVENMWNWKVQNMKTSLHSFCWRSYFLN
jgi:hypothetical protein